MTMYRNTLLNLINPVISIDEYEPKSGTDEEIIVVAFEVDDEQPAKDLNKFIQRGVVNVIDSDVSPNPNEHGKYYTFLEFKRNSAFYMSLLELIEDISNITGPQKWKVQVHKSGKLIDLYDKTLKSILNDIATHDFKQDSMTLESMLQDSDVETVVLNENSLVLSSVGYKLTGTIVALSDNPTEILKESVYIFNKTHEVQLLSAILGEKWTVSKFGKYTVAEKDGNSLVLSDVEQLYN